MPCILSNDKAFPLAVGGWKDHVHVFFELPVTVNVCDLMTMLKATSSKWINDNRLVNGKFRWQEGYAAFSNSKSQRGRVINYIMNQEAHHQKKTFEREYLGMLEQHNISFNEKYLFEFYKEINQKEANSKL